MRHTDFCLIIELIIRHLIPQYPPPALSEPLLALARHCSQARIIHTARQGREGLTTTDRERLKALERENRELKRANEILRKASAFFAQAELDRKAR